MPFPPFSRRTAWQWIEPVETPRPQGPGGAEVLDLTLADPTACGLTYEPSFYESLVDARSARYQPCSLGLPVAREAIAAYYAARGCAVAPDRIWLAAGTSELLAQLFWLLADPGDAVAVPVPGYPLYDVIGDLAGVRRVSYSWRYEAGWHLDSASLQEALGAEGLKAVCVVSPNHPTGSVLRGADRAVLEAACRERGLGLVVDEVFADYPLDGDALPMHARREWPGLAFVLSGLSKVAALPQMKLAWGVVLGPDAAAAEALARIELMADTFLSVSTPVQLALPRILSSCGPMQAVIRARCRENFQQLRIEAARSAFSVLAAEGGWTALVRLPQLAGWDDARWVDALRRDAGLVTQAGNLFDLPESPPHLVLSLLLPKRLFSEGSGRLAAEVDRRARLG